MPSPKYSLGSYPPIESVRRKRKRMARGGEPLHRALIQDTTAYLCYILLVAAVGPLQFGFHLVQLPFDQDLQKLRLDRQSLTLLKMSSPARRRASPALRSMSTFLNAFV